MRRRIADACFLRWFGRDDRSSLLTDLVVKANVIQAFVDWVFDVELIDVEQSPGAAGRKVDYPFRLARPIDRCRGRSRAIHAGRAHAMPEGLRPHLQGVSAAV